MSRQSVLNGKMSSATIQQWIANRLVPVKSKPTLYDRIKKLNGKAKIPSSWRKTGKPRLLVADALPRI
jgi:hypothetical protein